jgi:hypothetical protein
VPSTMHLAVALQNATATGSCDRLPCPCSMLSLHWHVEAQGNVLVGKLAVRQLRTKGGPEGGSLGDRDPRCLGRGRGPSDSWSAHGTCRGSTCIYSEMVPCA